MVHFWKIYVFPGSVCQYNIWLYLINFSHQCFILFYFVLLISLAFLVYHQWFIHTCIHTWRIASSSFHATFVDDLQASVFAMERITWKHAQMHKQQHVHATTREFPNHTFLFIYRCSIYTDIVCHSANPPQTQGMISTSRLMWHDRGSSTSWHKKHEQLSDSVESALKEGKEKKTLVRCIFVYKYIDI
jgi:hypothetical protein